MKKKLTAIPHTASHVLMTSNEGHHYAMVDVTLAVPSRVAAHLAERQNGESVIPCAGIGSMKFIALRVRQWTRPFKGNPPLREHLMSIEEGCDTSIRVSRPLEEWHLIGYLCGRLRITPGQWFAACAAYNAEVAEKAMDKALRSLQE
jgi:hypothetical protein